VSDGKLSNEKQQTNRFNLGSIESFRSHNRSTENARASADIYVRLARLEEQLLAEQHARLGLVKDLNARLGLVKDLNVMVEKVSCLAKSLQLVDEAVGSKRHDLERNIVERAVSEAKVEARKVLDGELQDIQIHARSLVSRVDAKLAHDRATKMQTVDGRDVGDLAEQLDAYQSTLESLQVALARQAIEQGRTTTQNEADLCKSLQLEICKSNQKHRTIASSPPASEPVLLGRVEGMICKFGVAHSREDTARNSNSATSCLVKQNQHQLVGQKRCVQFCPTVEEREFAVDEIEPPP